MLEEKVKLLHNKAQESKLYCKMGKYCFSAKLLRNYTLLKFVMLYLKLLKM